MPGHYIIVIDIKRSTQEDRTGYDNIAVADI